MTGPTIRPMGPDDIPAALDLARALPEWFNDAGLEQIAADLPHEIGAVAESGGEMVGWVTWVARGGVGEICWIAVDAASHRRGIGTALLRAAEDRLRSTGIGTLRVETLGESVDYEPYERTRAFYRARGFRFLKSELLDDPGMPEKLTLEKPLPPET